MDYLLVVSGDRDKVILAFENLDGDVEYTTFEAKDGGILTDESKRPSILAVSLALDSDIKEYEAYKIKELN